MRDEMILCGEMMLESSLLQRDDVFVSTVFFPGSVASLGDIEASPRVT